MPNNKRALDDRPCLGCGTTDIAAFGFYVKRGYTTRHSRCSKCRYIQSRNWISTNSERHNKWQLNYIRKKAYGLDHESAMQIWLSQNKMCAICKIQITFEKGCIDHNHTTKKVRGMLCSNCNRGIGLLKDNVDTLKSAITYLETTDN